MHNETVYTVIVTILFICANSSFAIEGIYKVIIQKEEKKRQSRFTILDYIFLKKKAALQDQWLALNSSKEGSAFEIKGYGSTGDLERHLSTATTYTEDAFTRYGGAMRFYFLGLEGGSEEFSEFSKSTYYQGNLTLFGNSYQGTHLTGFYGVRDFQYGEFLNYGQSYYGGMINLYLLSFIGVEGVYRQYEKIAADEGGFEMDGYRTEGGVFIDLFILRVKGSFFRERLTTYGTTSDTIRDEKGAILSGALFF